MKTTATKENIANLATYMKQGKEYKITLEEIKSCLDCIDCYGQELICVNHDSEFKGHDVSKLDGICEFFKGGDND